MYDITVLGELLIDFTYCGHSEAGSALFEQNAGGAVANVAVSCSMFGLKSAFIGKVGKDMHGAFLRDTLRAKGVDTAGLIEDDKVFTTLAFVEPTEHERICSFARKPGADTCLTPAELSPDILKNTKVFHYGSLSVTDEPARSATLEAVKIAKEAGAICTYDPNYRPSLWENEETAARLMKSLVQYADIVKAGEEEILLLTGTDNPEDAAKILINQGVKIAAVTMGPKGSLAATGAGIVSRPAAPCAPIDATGAGDAFFGAFLCNIIKGSKKVTDYSLEEIGGFLEFSNKAAALCTERRGAIPAMPTLEEVIGNR